MQRVRKQHRMNLPQLAPDPQPRAGRSSPPSISPDLPLASITSRFDPPRPQSPNQSQRQHGITRLITFRCDLLAQHHARVLVAVVLLRSYDISDNASENHLVTCCSESTMPTIVQSVGVSSRLNGKLASLPRHQNTNSPMPAPTASTATIGLPIASRFLSTVWTTSNFRPCNDSFLTVATTVPITRASCISLPHINRINHPDDRCIHRHVFHSLRQSCT